jgi:SWI/SNF-related matrix-associated actin-dependent regulator of chromatin subfamily A3
MRNRHLAPNSLSVHRYHLASKEKSLRKLLEYDVVMTTYATITAEFSDPDNCRLHQISWYRIVLDEGKIVCDGLMNIHAKLFLQHI